MVDERELKAIVQMLSTTAKMAEQIRMTSGLEDQQSSSSAAQQYNAVVKRLENTDTIPRDMFLQLEEGASLQDVGISSGQLAAYLTGLIEQPDEDRKDKEGAYHRVDSPEINIFGTTPDMQKLIEMVRQAVPPWMKDMMEKGQPKKEEQQQQEKEKEDTNLNDVESKIAELGAQMQVLAEKMHREELTADQIRELAEQMRLLGQKQSELAKRHAAVRATGDTNASGQDDDS